MGQIDVTDAWLYKYMSIVDEAIINEIEKNVDYDYAFSDEFNRKMERTIRKEKFIPFWNSVSKFGKTCGNFCFSNCYFVICSYYERRSISHSIF